MTPALTRLSQTGPIRRHPISRLLISPTRKPVSDNNGKISDLKTIIIIYIDSAKITFLPVSILSIAPAIDFDDIFLKNHDKRLKNDSYI